MIVYDVKDEPKALAVLYNASKPQGMGILHYDPKPMTLEEASRLLSENKDGYFDYLKGRVMKTLIKDGKLDPWLYDRDNGTGAAAAALKKAGIPFTEE